MTAKLLSGGEVADAVLADVAERVARLRERGIVPGLGTILVGEDPPSAGYVRRKHETCERVGITSHHRHIDASEHQAALLAAVDAFNADPGVDAYIIQHPVPKGFDFGIALSRMLPEKDADGLHPVNLGKLVLQEDGPLPCTPAGIVEMLRHHGIALAGREVCVVGRGPTLGRPLALLLTLKRPYANAAVTVVHSGVPDLGAYTRRAEIVIAAAGSPSIIKPDMLQRGAVVVSGGITWEGKRLVPDVDETCSEVASWITPRIGGVGPTTVALLMRNTVDAAERRSRNATA